MPGVRPVPLDLSSHFNNAGIAPDGRPPEGGLDGMGTAFRSQSLPAPGGTILSQGIPFLFPDRRDSKDNISCEAQVIPLPPSTWTTLHVLGMCDWRAFEEPLRLKASDGTWAETRLGLSDATRYGGLQYGESAALSCPLLTPDTSIPLSSLIGSSPPEAGCETEETRIEAGIWHQVIGLPAPRPLSALLLPDNPSMHLFALTLAAADPVSP
ncbi:MAG: hypothetical protein OXG13_08360 [Gemmatimonadaceae bacterium]|nr:hypothetical protein [Gemmatimonadaceae bacterium]